MATDNELPPVNSHSLNNDDSDCSIIVPMTKDELYQELDELLTAFCSDAQQQFCVDQNVIELDDLERIRQTVQQVQTLLPTVDRNNNLQLRRALARAIHDILQYYGNACQQRNMRLFDEILTNQYIGDWHRLKQQWELKARENQHILLILDDISFLTQSWLQHHQHNTTNTNSNKNLAVIPSLSSLPHRLSSTAKKRASSASGTNHKTTAATTTTTTTTTSSTRPLSSVSSSLLPSPSSTAADILASILTTFDYPPGAYTVIIDKHNYGQLGLQHGKIGTRQIIFDSHQLSSSDIIETVNQICDIFASLFASTAHHHLAQIDAQVRKAQPFYTMTHIKRLSTRIFDGDAARTTISEDVDMEYEERHHELENVSTSAQHHHQRRPSSTSDIASSSYISTSRLLSTPGLSSPSQSSPSPAYPTSSSSSSMAVLTPFRLSMTTPHMLWHHPIPIPSFAPAPWQLPDLLKPRHPYNPLFFGLIRRRASITSTNTHTSNKQQQSSSFLKRAQPQHYHNRHHHHHHRDQMEHMPTKTTSAIRGKNTGYQHHRTSSATMPTARATTSSTAPTATTTTATTGYTRNAPDTSANLDGHATPGMIQEDIDNSNNGYQPPRLNQPRPSTSTSTQRHSNTLDRTRHFVSRAMHGGDTMDDDEDTDMEDATQSDTWGRHSNKPLAPPKAPFTSVSVDKLSFHLGKIAGQFYQDLLMHTRLRYQETQSGLQSLEWQMMDLYRHLQLASSRAVMQRAMMIVQELDDEDNFPQQQQQQQHYGYEQRSPPPECYNGTHNNNNNTVRQYGDDEDSNSSSDSSNDEDGGHQQHASMMMMANRWTPICTTNDSSTTPPPLVYHSGTTTATSASSASQQALRSSCTDGSAPPPVSFDDDNDLTSTSCYPSTLSAPPPPLPDTTAIDSHISGHSSLSPIDKQHQSQMQQQQNNPALSITSSFTTAAS